MWIERCKWTLANVGWPFAFTFWFQIIVVLYASHGLIGQFALYYFHFLWIIIVCAFFSASFAPPDDCRKVMGQDTEAEDFCKKCNFAKPARWHHCRRCNQCVHRMDHHCPILQLCIHRGNHKFFLLFLLWPLQLAIFTVYHGFQDFLMMVSSSFSGEEISSAEQLRGTGVSNAMMVGFAALYLLKFQIPNLLRNQTLIEESREITDYDLGSWHENVKSIMGPWRTAWLPIPIPTPVVEKSKSKTI